MAEMPPHELVQRIWKAAASLGDAKEPQGLLRPRTYGAISAIDAEEYYYVSRVRASQNVFR
jgi:hypothetical protein